MTRHHQEISTVLRDLGVDPAQGLPGATAATRLRECGPNLLTGRSGRSPWRILADQFTSLMVLLLLGAAAVSGIVLGEHEDAIVIVAVVILNAALGFRQEFKAEQAIAALKQLAVPHVRVRRDGRTREIPAPELVPGDVVDLEAGARVPADCRLIESANLSVRESALTGEAEAVHKQTDVLAERELPVGDRRNMAFMGTVVTYGRGVGVVTATGMDTELGHIAAMIQEAEDEDTVLQRKLDGLSRLLVGAALVLISVVAIQARVVQHMEWKQIFMTAVSMAVAAIPEGLPAAVTIALALGAQRMLKRRALIRRLPAVETLGSVTVVCSDKTGTLTQNRMTVNYAELFDREVALLSDPAARNAQLAAQVTEDVGLGLLLAGGALCSDAEVTEDDDGEPAIIGDPTEGALVMTAGWAGWSKPALADALPRVGELPFDSDRKRMTTLHEIRGGTLPAGLTGWLRQIDSHVAFTKGATSAVLDVCERVLVEDRIEPMQDAYRARIEATNDRLAGQGIRVLAVAMREGGGRATPREDGLIYIGLVGMLDPLRQEVSGAVATCHAAGVRPVMITGDHPLIAQTIGAKLGLTTDGGVMTGREVSAVSDEELRERVRSVSVFARVSPEHKLRIVDALQKNGHVVAMTGDGVNDAPALKEADIGVAMGITGTDVSKEASDMVLQDDNFATIVAAVEQGRIILDNIIRFVRYILASNWAEILVMLAAPLFGLPLPLLPVQILWMNLVTDGLPALALGVERGERNVMERPPRSPQAPIIDGRMGLHILLLGGTMAAVALLLGMRFYDVSSGGVAHGHGADVAATTWQTMVFTALVFSQLTLALAERSTTRSFFTMGMLTNRFMVGAVSSAFALQLAVIYVPSIQRFFRTCALSVHELLWCALASVVVFVVAELKKLMLR